MKKRFFFICIWLLSAVLLVGCSGETRVKSDLGVDGAPDWVNEGTQAVSNDDGRFIFGVGMAPNIGDFSLQKSTAENRARAEIARVLSVSMDTVHNDYQGSDGEDVDTNIEHEINAQTQLVLTGVKVIGHWRDQSTEDIYAIVQLDLEKLEKSIKRADKLSDSFKRRFIKNTNLKFDRFMKGNM
ncbi:LPP20 family lipoprotein [Zooshikella ganghwensis]|uniref:LPP20 family lipoprotein n=1 Tax=Zooshikella ganghwensis TaxID=202772 RepID=UPI00040A2167|nr:LPP20 family lipoprotein [Zooshikella ganghwensis]